MEIVPLYHMTQSTGRERALDDSVVDPDRDVEAAVLRMKVRRGMLVVVHRDDDSEEPRDLGHSLPHAIELPSCFSMPRRDRHGEVTDLKFDSRCERLNEVSGARVSSTIASAGGGFGRNILRSQSVTSSSWGGRRYTPDAFTEQGVAMLSTVLKSERAIHVNIAVMRTFVRPRELIASNAHLARKLSELGRKYDRQFKVVFEAIRQLMAPPPEVKKDRIGFQSARKRKR
jgi:hypothetical protein